METFNKFQFPKNQIRAKLFSNKYLLSNILSYCSPRELIICSLVSKAFNKASKDNDSQFKETGFEIFCKKPENLSVINSNFFCLLNPNQIIALYKSIIGDNRQLHEVSETFIPLNYTWRELVNIGYHIQSVWNKNNFKFILMQDLQLLRSELYQNFKQSNWSSVAWNKNKIVENEFNSELQMFFLNLDSEEEYIYKHYGNILSSSNGNFQPINKMTYFREVITNYNMYNQTPQRTLFSDFLINFSLYYNTIKNSPQQYDQLGKLRWYLCFDECNYVINESQMKENEIQINEGWEIDFNSNFGFMQIESDFLNEKEKIKNTILIEYIILTHSLINKLINGEINPIFSTIKCLYLSSVFHCQYIMNYLYSTYSQNKEELISNYNNLYKNYVKCALKINSLCNNINVAINFLYEKLYPDYPSTPKFNVFRLMMRIWFKEIQVQISKNDSIVTLLSFAISSIYSSNLAKDFNDITKECKKNSMLKKVSENYNNSYSSFQVSQSLNTKISSEQSIFRLYSGLNENSLLLEEGINTLIDISCNECTVVYLNHSEVDTNKSFNDVYMTMCDLIESEIKKLYNTAIIKHKVAHRIVVDSIIKYFNHYFYSTRIINKLRIELYRKVHFVLSHLLYGDICHKFETFIVESRVQFINEAKAKYYIDNYGNQFENEEVYIQLNRDFAQIIPSNYLRATGLIKFISDNLIIDGPYLLLREINEWIKREEDKIKKINKKVLKENQKRNIPLHLDEINKSLFEMCDSISWEKVLEIRNYI